MVDIVVGVLAALIVLGAAGIIIASVIMKRKRMARESKRTCYQDSAAEIETQVSPNAHYDLKDLTSVKDVGISSDPNKAHRERMEDAHVLIDKFGGIPTQGYFAIYDGHGGKSAVEFVQEHLHENLLLEMSKGVSIAEAFRAAYLNTDKELAVKDPGKAGCTAVSALFVRKDDNTRMLYIANVGDSHAFLLREGKSIRLTYEHKPSDPKEAERLKAIEGGIWISNNKVAGMLAVSRAFGNKELKNWVPADPSVNEILLTSEDRFLVLACDGLWDVCTPLMLEPLVMKNATESAQNISNRLVQYALEHKTTDNVTVMVIKI